MVTQPRRVRALALLFGIVTTASLAVTAPVAAEADTAPISSATPTTVSSDPLPTVQQDGVAWTQVVIGDTVYVGGAFANASPAGSAAGTNLVPRANLLAYSLSTGALVTAFAPTFNAQVRALAASADGSILYAGGNFTQVNGVNSYRTVALNARTGAIITTFKATTDAAVYSLAVSGSTLFIGGAFGSINSVQQPRLAAVDAATGALKAWYPTIPGGTVRALVVSTDGSEVVLGGNFPSVNGSTSPGRGLAMVSTTSAGLLPFAVAQSVQDYGANSAIYSLWSDGSTIFGTGYVYGTPGNLEGAFSATWTDGTINWIEDCHGDTYSIAALGDAVYTASHAHFCGDVPGGFPQTNSSSTLSEHQRAIAFTKRATSTVATNPISGYADWGGRPAPSMLSWLPDFAAGTVTGQDQASWSVTASGSYVLYAGEFPTVNGKTQAGIVRFALPTIAPNTDGPRLGGTKWVPTAVSTASGSVRVSWLTNWDRDNENLTYTLYRDGTSSPIFTTTAASDGFWNRPYLSYVDSGRSPGSTPTYQVKATDPFGNVSWSGTISTTVGTSNPGAYAQAVVGDGASDLWSFGESAGPAVYDRAGGAPLTASTGVTFGTAGPLAGDATTAATFSGTSAGSAATNQLVQAPNAFSVEAWFKTTSRSGGKIVGFGNLASGLSTSSDRSIYMDANGTLHFGVSSGGNKILNSSSGYNNGAWHVVTGTLGSGGMTFAVDGVIVGTNSSVTSGGAYAGYWRIGGDKSWNNLSWFSGSIADVAVYPTALTSAQIAAHFRAGTVTATSTATAAMTATGTGLSVAFDGSSSSDIGSTITGWAWSFGDGSTGTGATTQHTYTAGGTYTASLTVTDALGATNTTSRSVTVAAAAVGATDSFSRTVTGGLGSADTGGAWTTSGGSSNVSVGSGSARFSTPAGVTLNGVLGSLALSSADVQSTVGVGALPVAGSDFVSLIARKVGSDDYTGRVTVTAAGGVTIGVLHGGTLLKSATVSGLTVAPGTQLRVRVQALGSSPTTISAKVWVQGNTEPSAWQVTATDTTAVLQTAGSVGLRAYSGSGVTNGPLVTTFDDFAATTAQ